MRQVEDDRQRGGPRNRLLRTFSIGTAPTDSGLIRQAFEKHRNGPHQLIGCGLIGCGLIGKTGLPQGRQSSIVTNHHPQPFGRIAKVRRRTGFINIRLKQRQQIRYIHLRDQLFSR
jgi:hypothetical protein